MERDDYFRQLTDAIDLLTMVERLSEGLARESSAQEELPWAGIKLTLRQTKNLLFSTYDKLLTLSPPNSAFVQQQEKSPLASSAGPSLAERIQQAPTSVGRVRDILHSTSNSHSTGNCAGTQKPQGKRVIGPSTE